MPLAIIVKPELHVSSTLLLATPIESSPAHTEALVAQSFQSKPSSRAIAPPVALSRTQRKNKNHRLANKQLRQQIQQLQHINHG